MFSIVWFTLSWTLIHCEDYIFCFSQRPDDDDEDHETKGYAKISQFFSPNGTTTTKSLKRHRFFEERKLTTIDRF